MGENDLPLKKALDQFGEVLLDKSVHNKEAVLYCLAAIAKSNKALGSQVLNLLVNVRIFHATLFLLSVYCLI